MNTPPDHPAAANPTRRSSRASRERNQEVTTIDHQQAAIDQVAEILHDCFGCSPGGQASPGCECDPEPYESDAEHILTAATPHLRAGVAKEMRDFRDCYQHTYAIPGDPYAEGYLTACKAIIALLEGGGACCEHSKCPGGSICCCQEGGAE